MCGIVGYVGFKDPTPVLISGLEKLEYRGYDSAGLAVLNNGSIDIHRAEGKLSKLKDLLKYIGPNETVTGNQIHVGIGHTRWATHGKPSETNAHPHVAGKVAIVHNGIYENYAETKARLLKEGVKFQSETDTEVLAHLINKFVDDSPTLLEAVKKALHGVHGSYGLVVVSTKFPDQIVVTKVASPIVIGLADGENLLASDIPALLPYTRKVLILEDGEFAEIKREKVTLYDQNGVIQREPLTVTWDAVTAEKGGYRHFMLKEIHEQPQVVTDTIRGRMNLESGEIYFDDVQLTNADFVQVDRVSMVACGTAWHASLTIKYYIEMFAKLPVEVDLGSEFRYRNPIVNEKTLFVAVSQSGETADTLGSLGKAVELGVKPLAICNVVGSSIARKAGNVIYTHAGPEISVASTKAFLTQLTAGLLLALRLGLARGTLSREEATQAFLDIAKLPVLLADVLKLDKQIEKISRKYGKAGNSVLYLGRGMLFPTALEGALKMKELSYIHAEGYAAGELKHGPLALVSEEMPVVAVIGHDGVNYEKTMSNLKEVESRGGKTIIVTDYASAELREMAWELLEVGEVPQILLPMIMTVPLQLLAYHTAVYRGTDVDQPRNLAKSVTVE
jgi:glucosamine--fructose-6-phosphate aminotransferase (isomerizing)